MKILFIFFLATAAAFCVLAVVYLIDCAREYVKQRFNDRAVASVVAAFISLGALGAVSYSIYQNLAAWLQF